MKPDYCIYPSLLDKFQDLLDYAIIAEQPWNKVGEATHKKGEYLSFQIGDYKLTPDEMYEKIEVELINAINRCAHELNEAADKGTAFNEIVDCLIEHRPSSREDCKIYSTLNNENEHVIRAEINGFTFDFSKGLCLYAASQFPGSLTQFYTEAVMHTSLGAVKIYGYIDEWVGSTITDIKTTSSYTWGEYEHRWQRHCYPWCVIESGMATEISSFVYWVVEWAYCPCGKPFTAKGIHPEEYTYSHADSAALIQSHVEKFIDWLEYRRDYITDRRIFGGVNPQGYVGIPIDVSTLTHYDKR